MIRNVSWVLAALILCGLLVIVTISLAAGDTWTKKANMPTARGYFSTSAVDGMIYVIGGWINNNSLPTMEDYDPATNKWTKKADMPTARDSLSTSTVNGKIYAVGGFGPGGVSLATVEEYDPATNKWTRKADMPMKGGVSTSVVNGKIYAIGGFALGGGNA
ncbi:MAG: Kelch repeat-containing protein, partial [Candidatus Poribacteria bacterium]